jgi:5-methylcytosine-specific restriction endonuclease McrA
MPLAKVCSCGSIHPIGHNCRNTSTALHRDQRKRSREKWQSVWNTQRWRALRRDALNRAHHACEVCGAGPHEGVTLTVHHAEPFTGPDDPRAWNPNNLVVLCQQHHGRLHGGRH